MVTIHEPAGSSEARIHGLRSLRARYEREFSVAQTRKSSTGHVIVRVYVEYSA